MQHQDLHLLTVIELRKLAKESGVKLSAGISKEGIVQRLSAALYGDQSTEPGDEGKQAQSAQALTESTESQTAVQEEPQKADLQTEQPPEEDSSAPDSELYADVTKVQPRGGYRAWQGEQPPAPNVTPVYRPAWQARPQQSQAPHRPAGYPQPAWQQRVLGAPTRFGPPVSYPAQQPAPQPMMQEEAPARMQSRGPAPVRDNAPRLDGYRLGYRAAPQRQDYRDYGARQDYRPTPRQEAPYRAPAGYQQQPAQDVYYNDSVYKPVRDPAFSEGFDRGQSAPELLQAPEGTPAAGVLEILPDGYGFL
ncbi:MAG: hypothetical protein EOM69_06370, partial [Clostridia bacterium]|nr:hypothetical protein [Clostridia bacterium]